MATTTKKSAKTKTSKSKSTKSTKKPLQNTKSKAKNLKTAKVSSAKTTKKTTSKTVEIRDLKTAKKEVKSTDSWLKPTLARLRSMNMVMIGVYLLLAVAAGFLMNNTSAQISVGHLTNNALQSTNGTVFVPAVHALFDVELRWVVVALMVLSVIIPALQITKLDTKYHALLQKTTMQPMRWVDMGITGALMVSIVASLYGITDLITIKLFGAMIVTTAVLALVTDRQNNATTKPVRSTFYTSIFTAVLPLLALAVSGVATYVYGMVRSPWYVYAAFATVAVGLGLTLFNQWKQISGSSKKDQPLVSERNYLAISGITKIVFVVILVVGLRSV